MLTAHFRVECVDQATGKVVHHVFQTVSSEAAAELANRLGYAIGTVTAESPSPIQPWRPKAPRWLWLLIGTGLGIALTVGAFAAGLVNFSNKNAESERQDLTQALNSQLKGIGIDLSADQAWAERWPTLSFPRRATGAIPASVVREYDEYQDYTAFRSEVRLGGEYALIFYFLTTELGNVSLPASPPRTVSLRSSYGDSDKEMVFIADGRRIELKWGRGHWTLPTEELLTIATAKTVKGRCNLFAEFTLSAAQQTAISEFASVLKK